MSKLFSTKEIVKVLEYYNFYFVSQSGSHRKYKNNSGKVVIVPDNRKEMPHGTFKSISRQSGISEEDFKKNK